MNLDAVCGLNTSSARAYALLVLVLDGARLRRWPGNLGSAPLIQSPSWLSGR